MFEEFAGDWTCFDAAETAVQDDPGRNRPRGSTLAIRV
jgi:hypothetical protein